MVEKRNVYVGHRYVPKVMGEWDKQETYEGLSIVTYQGASYTSKKRVPVGIDISNEEYWVVTGNYNAQIEEYREDVKRVNEQLKEITLNVRSFGAIGDGIHDDTEGIQSAIDMAVKNKYNKLIFPKGVYKSNQINLNGVKNLDIISLNASIDYTGQGAFFNVSGDIENLSIVGFSFNGNDNENDFSSLFFGGSSGYRIEKVHIEKNNIKNVKVGINLNANLGGYVIDSIVSDNFIENAFGVDPGEGYGIHVANQNNEIFSNVVIKNNTIKNAERHAIYVARGKGYHVHSNKITDHRKNIVSQLPRSAIVISRSRDVQCHSNILINVTGVGIGVGVESETILSEYNAENIKVFNNYLENISLAAIKIFNISADTKNNLKDIDVYHNYILCDEMIFTSETRGIEISRGINVNVFRNDIRIKNDNNEISCYGIYIRAQSYENSEDGSIYLNDLVVYDNNIYVGNGFPFRLETNFVTSKAKARFSNNKGNREDIFMTSSKISNPNLIFIGQNIETLSFEEGIEPAFLLAY